MATITAYLISKILLLLYILEKKWRTDRDSNPGDGHPPTHFPGVRLRPLGHLSVKGIYTAQLN